MKQYQSNQLVSIVTMRINGIDAKLFCYFVSVRNWNAEMDYLSAIETPTTLFNRKQTKNS